MSHWLYYGAGHSVLFTTTIVPPNKSFSLLHYHTEIWSALSNANCDLISNANCNLRNTMLMGASGMDNERFREFSNAVRFFICISHCHCHGL